MNIFTKGVVINLLFTFAQVDIDIRQPSTEMNNIAANIYYPII